MVPRTTCVALACVAGLSLAASTAAADAPPPVATHPLRLEDAVRLALTRNERATIADENVEVAAAAAQRAVSPFLPSVNLNANDTQRPDDIVRAGQPSNVANASVTVNQPLLDAAAIPLYAQAHQNLEGQKAQAKDDKRLLAYDAARAYFVALSADAVLQAAQRRLDTSRANLADAQARVDAQLASTNDVTRAQVDLASSEREVELDRGSLQNAYVQLSFTIAARVTGGLIPPDPILRAGRQPVPGSDSLVRFALDHRPDVLARKHFTAASHDAAREPLLRLVPIISLSGQFSVTSNTASATGTPSHWNDELLEVSLSWPIFDAGARYADRRSRAASARIADLDTTLLGRTVDTQVRSATVSLHAAQAALSAAELAMSAARQSANETEILYRQGLAKAIELVDANDQRFQAEVNESTAEYSVALAYLGLRQALGLDPVGTELTR